MAAITGTAAMEISKKSLNKCIFKIYHTKA
jgi:hypothetical protein